MYDLAVIGTGPAGYHAAIRGAQLGLKVLAIESEAVGGVCLNIGCIPTKALLHAAEQLDHARAAHSFGLRYSEPEIDLNQLAAWRDQVVDKLTSGVESLFKANKVDLKRGSARISAPGRLAVGAQNFEAKKIVIATGSEPTTLANFEFDEESVFSSTGALKIEKGIPERFLVIGGGAVGLEFASVMKSFGAQVVVAEFMDQILPGSDPETVRILARALAKRGIELKTGTQALGYQKGTTGLAVTLKNRQSGAEETLNFDRILVAVGRKPRSAGLGLEAAGVRINERGFIVVNERMETNVPGIYAAGDIIGPPLLAHKGMQEGLIAAENAAGGKVVFDYQIPSVVYTDPEWASVGLSEAQAQERGFKVKAGKFPLSASGRAVTLGGPDGMFKVVADAESDLLLGVQIVGPQASELIGEATVALEMGATATDLALTIHAHPTLSEGLKEAPEALHKQAIHIINR